MQLSAVGWTAVALVAIPVAEVGIVQLPFVPDTANVTTSAARSGMLLAPTLSGAGRVSTSRHGTIGAYTDALAAPVARPIGPNQWR